MSEAIAHRGPDGEGSFVDGTFGMAHRRLAILDLSAAGHQPMATPDGALTISYNGEVYNFEQLRIQLESLGHQFRSRTDTEVVLRAWAEWGPASVEKLNGMFAFAIWDSRSRTLHLVRDRFGVKPLYIARRDRSVLFASEVKALLASRQVPAKLDPAGLVEYLSFQNFFGDRTLFDGVEMLPPGTILRVDEANGVGAPVRFASIEFTEPDEPEDDLDYQDELGRLFRQAVSRQLVADVPVSAYLSGGIDSGAIASVAAQQLPHLHTFTVGFDTSSISGLEIVFDERPRAEMMSYAFGTEHYEMVLKAGDMERSMGALVWHLEEPRVGQSYPNHYAARLAGRFAPVVLSGSGGDELFGGYPWRYHHAAGDRLDGFADRYFDYWRRLVPIDHAEAIFSPLGADGVVDVRAVFDRALPKAQVNSRSDIVNICLSFEARTFLHGLLVVEDKLSMAQGLEARVPFLDNDLAAFAQRLPARLKIAGLDGHPIEEGEPGKRILRSAVAHLLPATIVDARKQGFSAPDASWFRGESIDFVRRQLLKGAPRIFEWLDGDTVRTLVDDHLQGRENRRLLIWSLLSLEQWAATFLDGERPYAA